jgi:hypothetical protein
MIEQNQFPFDKKSENRGSLNIFGTFLFIGLVIFSISAVNKMAFSDSSFFKESKE